MLEQISGAACLRIFFLCALYLVHPALAAKELTHKLPSGIIASADYRAGAPSKPVALILHGYLQTRNFPLIYNLADALSNEGYAVLTPTLSLGVTHRSQSLACEAIHTHSMQDDVNELRYWINWLAGRGHKKIVLIGHSFAAVQFLSYAQIQTAVEVTQMIFISPSDMEHRFWSEGRVDRKNAAEIAVKNRTALESFELGFCRQYRSTAPAYLSYVTWTQERVLDALHKNKIPAVALFGETDTVVSKEWAAQVRKAGVKVTIIPDANHFFDDSSSEFELIEIIARLLQAAPEK